MCAHICVTDRRVECMECFKKLLSCCFYCLLERARGCVRRGPFLRPVRTLSETQPELINSNRPPHYPQCTVPRWWPVGGNTRNERKKNPPSSHTLLVYTPFSLARTAHNTPTVSQCCNNKHLQ